MLQYTAIQQLKNRASSQDTLDQQGQIVPLVILPVPIVPPPPLRTLGAGTCSNTVRSTEKGLYILTF
jgi:hypothetical protein